MFLSIKMLIGIWYLCLQMGRSVGEILQMCYFLFLYAKFGKRCKHQWFSGKIQRCHRWAPSSILGWCNLFCFSMIHSFRGTQSTDRSRVGAHVLFVTVMSTKKSTEKVCLRHIHELMEFLTEKI